jgi:ankyrin repeat protein
MTWKHSILPANANRLLAQICIWHIFELEGKRHVGLRTYSACSWTTHFKNASIEDDQDAVEKVMRMCEPTSDQFKTWARFSNDEELPAMRDSLSVASSLGLAIIVKALVNRHAQVNGNTQAKDGNGWTPLHWAASRQRETVAQLLIKAGADVNAKSTDDATPLHTALSRENLAMIRLLLDAGADVNARSRTRFTPLHLATLGGFDAAVKQLLRAGARDDWWDGSPSTARLLRNAGVRLEVRDRYFELPLFLAFAARQIPVLRVMFAEGASVDKANVWGFTLLTQACMEGYDEVIPVLLEAGADVNRGYPEAGVTALHRACSHGYTTIVQLLLGAGARPNAGTLQGETPLSQASYDGRNDIVKLLLSAGADVERMSDLMADVMRFLKLPCGAT